MSSSSIPSKIGSDETNHTANFPYTSSSIGIIRIVGISLGREYTISRIQKWRRDTSVDLKVPRTRSVVKMNHPVNTTRGLAKLLSFSPVG